MVNYHAVRCISQILVIIANAATVWKTTNLSVHSVKEWCKKVRVIVASFVLQNREKPLKTGPSVNVSVW